jgi:hypothetical protein
VAAGDFAEETRVPSDERPVPMKALQWGELEKPAVFIEVAVEVLLELALEAWPVPIAALQ